MQLTKSYPTVAALLSAAIVMPFALAMYLAFEPIVAQGQGVNEEFTVTQEITGEISFEVAPQDIVMSPTIPGISGGNALGSTSVRVSTNNPAGYTLEISFEDGDGMQQDGGSAVIPNLGVTAGSADFDMAVVAGEAFFGVTASSSSSIADLQEATASTCGAGTPSVDSCFIMPTDSSSNFTLVNRTSETLSAGELTDIGFKVAVGPNPSPTLPIDTYTATATLTATEN